MTYVHSSKLEADNMRRHLCTLQRAKTPFGNLRNTWELGGCCLTP